MIRTASIYRHQTIRAKTTLPYTLCQFREHVTMYLRHLVCLYCKEALTPGNFSADHNIPMARSGSTDDLNNITICCTRCNQIKGQLTGEEFFALLLLANQFEPQAKRSLLARLRAGGKLTRN